MHFHHHVPKIKQSIANYAEEEAGGEGEPMRGPDSHNQADRSTTTAKSTKTRQDRCVARKTEPLPTSFLILAELSSPSKGGSHLQNITQPPGTEG